jgi:hypothetical protein
MAGIQKIKSIIRQYQMQARTDWIFHTLLVEMQNGPATLAKHLAISYKVKWPLILCLSNLT